MAVAVLCAVAAGVAACSGGDDTGAGSGEAAADGAEATTGEWARVGFDLANTRATDDESIGADEVADLAPAWALDGVTGVSGTPAVVDGTVYVGDWTSHVRALDAATGEERWAHDLESSYVGGSVVVDADVVYVGTFDARIVALDRATGEPAWETDIDPYPKAVVFGSPVVADGLVVTGVGSFEVFVPSDPPTFRGTVVALDAETGDEVWRFHVTDQAAGEGAGVSVWSSPAIDRERGVLYIGTGQAYSLPAPARSDSLVALDLATGEEVWHRQFTAGDAWSVALPSGLDADVGAMPNLFTVDGTDAVGVGDKAGTYRALDRDSGEILWEAPLTEGGLQGGVMASAAVAGGTVYVTSNDGQPGRRSRGPRRRLRRRGVADRGRGARHGAGHVGERGVVPRRRLGAHRGLRRRRRRPPVGARGRLPRGRRRGGRRRDGVRRVGVVAGRRPRRRRRRADRVPAGRGGRHRGRRPTPTRTRTVVWPAPETPRPTTAPAGATCTRSAAPPATAAAARARAGPSLAGVADRLSLDDHIAVVRDGRGQMPGWDGTLSDEEIEAVVAYERDVLSGDAGG